MESEIRIKGSVTKRRRSELASAIEKHMEILSTNKGNDTMPLTESVMQDMRRYADMDIDELLSQLSPREIEQLSLMVDPDDSMIPPSERCNYRTNKEPTGPLNRQKLLKFLEQYAKEQDDVPEVLAYTAGMKRGRVYVAPLPAKVIDENDSILIELDLEEDSKQALMNANQSDLVDLAAILGLHSMLSQDQYHASIQNKGQMVGATFESLVKASMPKHLPLLPDNDTSPSKSAQKVLNDDEDMVQLNWNNIKAIKRDDFKMLFDGLRRNTHLKTLSLANTNLTDSTAEYLVEAIRQNKHLKVLNVESNYISGNMLRNLFEASNATQSITELRAANQRPSILGNKIEMELARLIELNKTLLSVGIHLDFADARVRVARHLQQNLDRIRKQRMGKE